VEDRLGSKIGEAEGNPWWKLHSPLMEFEEVTLERRGLCGRIRPSGFIRLAYSDQVDGSVQFCRVYLPPSYNSAKKWPLVVFLHGRHFDNPAYIRWWCAHHRHAAPVETEFAGHEEVIYMEPHGRGNANY